MDDLTEEPYACEGCGTIVGIMISQAGRVIGLRIPTITTGYILVRNLNAACECCGNTIRFSVSDLVLRQVLLELQRVGYF